MINNQELILFKNTLKKIYQESREIRVENLNGLKNSLKWNIIFIILHTTFNMILLIQLVILVFIITPAFYWFLAMLFMFVIYGFTNVIINTNHLLLLLNKCIMESELESIEIATNQILAIAIENTIQTEQELK
jgi:hypothetical protein